MKILQKIKAALTRKGAEAPPETGNPGDPAALMERVDMLQEEVNFIEREVADALEPFAIYAGELKGSDSRTLLITNGKSITIGDMRRAATAYYNGTNQSPTG